MRQTKNYDMFKKHPHNRVTHELNIVKLQKSLSERNLLKARPILVNEQLEIIDGQHRLEAARRLGIPVYYEVISDSECTDVLLLNANQKQWSKQDYLDYFVKQGNQEYLKLEAFMRKHGLDLRMATTFLNQTPDKGNPKMASAFCDGDYKFPDEERLAEADLKVTQVRRVMEYLTEKMSGNKKYLTSCTVTRALCSLMNYKNFDFDLFMNKLPYKLDTIHPCSREMDYVEMLKNIYNWRNKAPLGYTVRDESLMTA